ncbi:MAG: thiol peroxidase [Candidatus Omnitrophica bacterium]|nr:thiol peroxidase [Candidatus Omnitrophota bacterium]
MLEKVTFKGAPLTLVGRSLKENTPAPDFIVVSQDLKEKSLADFSAKIKIITFFPSLDTPVCDLQVKEFNKKASGISPEVVIIGISKDLPFAQQRFCEAFEIKNVSLLSDYKTSSFGINYGLLIKELNLLARGALILDKNNILRYRQVVGELTAAPDYAAALGALEAVLENPALPIVNELPNKCKPCTEGMPSLAQDKIKKLLAQYRGWELVEDKKLVKEFKFKDFLEAKYFLDLVAVICQEQGHHPHISLGYAKLKITLTTHAAGGLTDNDFILAGMIDQLNN